MTTNDRRDQEPWLPSFLTLVALLFVASYVIGFGLYFGGSAARCTWKLIAPERQ